MSLKVNHYWHVALLRHRQSLSRVVRIAETSLGVATLLEGKSILSLFMLHFEHHHHVLLLLLL